MYIKSVGKITAFSTFRVEKFTRESVITRTKMFSPLNREP